VQGPDRTSFRRRWQLTLAALAALAALVVAIPASAPDTHAGANDSGVRCSRTVSSATGIVSAAHSASNRGKVVCVAAGNYGRLSLDGVAHPDGAKVTLRSRSRHKAVLDDVEIGDVAGLRLQGFRVEGGFEHPADGSVMQAVDLVGNDVGGSFQGAFMLDCKVYDVAIAHNRIHDIRDDTNWYTGWGIRLSGSPSSSGCDWRRNIRIRYNTFAHTQNDAMDIGATDGGQIVGNIVTDINKGPLDRGEHTDALMLWADSKNFLIKDNRFVGNADQWLVSGGTHNVRVINNLIVRGNQWGFQAGEAGSSGAGIHSSVFRNNTIWSTGAGWNDQCSRAHPDTNCMGIDIKGQSTRTNTFDHNLVDMVSGCRYVDAGSRNLIYSHRPGLCRPGDRYFNPRFASTPLYQAKNLPRGYRDVGYRPAPAGYRAKRR
jgi:hypothetical protein